MIGFLAFLALFPGCHRSKSRSGGADSKIKVEGYVTPGPNTRILTAKESASLLKVDETGMLIFSADIVPPQQNLVATAPFHAGQVIVMGTHAQAPQGLLRKVTSVVTLANGFAVATAPATLADAIQDADVRISYPLDQSGAKETMSPKEGVSPQDPSSLRLSAEQQGFYFGLNDFVVADIDGDKNTKDDQVVLNGNFGVDLGVDITFKIKSFSVKEASFSIKGSESGTLALKGNGGVAFKESLDISLLHYPPVVVTIGAFPLVLTASLGVGVGAEGEGSGAFSASAHEEAHITLGAGYVDGSFGPITAGDVTGKAESPQIDTASFSSRAYGSVRGELSVYGSSGGYVSMEGFAAFSASMNATDCYLAKAGLGVQAGLFVGIFGIEAADYEKSWELAAKEIGKGSCNIKGATGQDPQAYSWLYQEPTTDNLVEGGAFDVTSDGGLIAARGRNVRGYVLKINRGGDVGFYRDSQTANSESYRRIKALKDGGSVIVGSSVDPVVTRLDQSGAVKWAYKYGYSATYFVPAVDEGGDGSIVFGGRIYNAVDPNDDMLVAKLNAAGDVLWSKRLKGAQNIDRVNTIKVLPDNRIVLAGTYGITAATDGVDPEDKIKGSLGWLAILSADGAVQQSKLYSAHEIVDAVPINGGGDGFLVLGFTERTVSDSLVRVPWVMKLKSDGTVDWRQGLLEQVSPTSIALAADGGALVAGIRNFAFGDKSKQDGWLARFSPSGTVAWARQFGSEKEDGLLFVHQRGDGRILAGGYNVPAANTVRPWFLSLAASGEGTFKSDSGYASANTSATLFTPPLSYIDAPLTPSDITFAREEWQRTLTKLPMSSEMIAGP